MQSLKNVVFIERNCCLNVGGPTPLPPLLAITGPRACGKTFLAQILFPSHRHIALALPSEATRARLDPAAFLASQPAPVVIDDVHLEPRLIHHLANEVARRPCPPAGYVVVGSRPATIEAAFAAALHDRSEQGRLIRIEGLSHAETTAARPELTIADRLLRGGFPAIYADRSSEPWEFMRSLVADHLARELPRQLRVDSPNDFERFLRSVALRTGQVLNKAALAREIGIAGSTAAIWLDTLIDAGVVTLLWPWKPSQGRPLVRSPKVYFADTGLCCHLLGIRTAAELTDSPHAAALWETAVHSELRRLLAAASPAAELIFWRDRTKEADFLVPTSRGLVIIDVAWTEFPPVVTTKRLLRIRSLIGEEAVASLAVACRTPTGQGLREPAGPSVETVGLDDLPGLIGNTTGPQPP
ncbi:MAG: DUF4143 domain-containing protein [Planctomycetota bacterium]|nr:DUF4143 domain-containing protein [Planctomycetota bacterium]